MSLNDQWEHGRIPLRVFPYKLALEGAAHTCEFIIDYTRDEDGTEPLYHMYIVSPDDNHEFIDLTQKIITEILPNAQINANQFQILIEGIKDPVSLQDIINFIYKRFIYPDDPNGFDPERDLYKLFDPTAKDVLLRNTDGTILFPITRACDVYDDSGKTLQERLDDMTRLGFSMTYVVAATQNQNDFWFDYPFPNYSDFVEVRIGTVYVDKTRYHINTGDPGCLDEDGRVVRGHLIFHNYAVDPRMTFEHPLGERIERGRRIDILFIYNALAKSDGDYEYMYGGNIADASIPTRKLEKVTDSYYLNDPTTIASAAAVYNLFMEMGDIISNNIKNAMWCVEQGSNADLIEITTNKTIIGLEEPVIINVVLKANKSAKVSFKITDAATNKTYALIFPDGHHLSRGFLANKTVRFLIDGNTAYILSTGSADKYPTYYNHFCKDQETVISYAGLAYNDGDIINVYRNGVRIFDTVDFNFTDNETITLLTRTEGNEQLYYQDVKFGERITFEALSSSPYNEYA